jgi:ankyrin repeat protein
LTLEVDECKPLLLGAGADVNKDTKAGVAPLYVAAQNDKVEAAERLIAAGADVDKATTVDGWGLHSSTFQLNLSRF